jgi:hypothetical protein
MLNRILSKSAFFSLNEIFEQRLAYLSITKNQALNIMGMELKTLNAFLSGDAKKVDFVTILKLSDFLQISSDEIIGKYFQAVNNTYSETINEAKRKSFIVNSFNLPSLKKIGLISNITDFDHIEQRINTFFGYESVFEYDKHKITAAFSSGKRTTNKENLRFWYAAACESLERTPNPYEYDRQALIDYFPQIRWYSTDVQNGLLIVAQALFRLGVTLIFVPKFTPDLHVRGATLAYRDKPCIIMTKYTKFYGTLWFALIHELFHVLYDWEEIRNEQYHISGESSSMKINEAEANNFAREYLFSNEKMEIVKPSINNPKFVRSFAEKNHIHPSIIYTFYNWDCGEDKSTYAKFDRFMPDFSELMEHFKMERFRQLAPVKEISRDRNLELYNSI